PPGTRRGGRGRPRASGESEKGSKWHAGCSVCERQTNSRPMGGFARLKGAPRVAFQGRATGIISGLSLSMLCLALIASSVQALPGDTIADRVLGQVTLTNGMPN